MRPFSNAIRSTCASAITEVLARHEQGAGLNPSIVVSSRPRSPPPQWGGLAGHTAAPGNQASAWCPPTHCFGPDPECSPHRLWPDPTYLQVQPPHSVVDVSRSGLQRGW